MTWSLILLANGCFAHTLTKAGYWTAECFDVDALHGYFQKRTASHLEWIINLSQSYIFSRSIELSVNISRPVTHDMQ